MSVATEVAAQNHIVMFSVRLGIRISLGFALLFVFVSGSANAQTANVAQDALTDARVDWHLAAIAEAKQDWKSAEAFYQKVCRDVVPLPIGIRLWFRGTASYGMGLNAARLGDTAGARSHISDAAERHFWNFDVLRADSVLCSVCGRSWIDSLQGFWTRVRLVEQRNWQAQTTKILRPNSLSDTGLLPIIVALHGGNASADEFTEYWQAISDKTQSVVILPPGIIRESDITNSWGQDVHPVEKLLCDLIPAIYEQKLGDTSRIYLAGYSQGAHMAIEVGLRHPRLFAGVISICGFVNEDPDSQELRIAKGEGLRVCMIVPEGEMDLFKTSIVKERENLERAGVQTKFELIKGMVHEMPLDFVELFSKAWRWMNASITSDEPGIRDTHHSGSE